MKNQYGHFENLVVRLLIGSVFLLLAAGSTADVLAQNVQPSNATDPEAFILNQLRVRREANLASLPDRKISAEFLEALLLGESKDSTVNGAGIAILNAQIVGDLEIPNREVSRETILNGCQFGGKVDFSGTHFHYDLSLENAVFSSPVLAGQLKVDGDLNLNGVRARDDFDFASLRVGGSLFVDGARISGENKPADFEYARVGEVAYFRQVDLSGPLLLSGADFEALILGGAPAPKELDLDGTVVDREMRMQTIKLDILNAAGLHVNGQTFLQDVEITRDVDLTNAHFQDLSFQDSIIWPRQESSLRMDGITFASISPGKEKIIPGSNSSGTQARWKWLLDNWVDRSTFSPQVYQQLQTAFQNVGLTDLSNNAFERMKIRERTGGHLSPLGKLWNFLQWLLVGYGREPQRALAWSIAVVAFGCFVFRSKYMTVRKAEDGTMTYNAFWYSLGLFLPLETLLASDVWVPKQDDRFRRNYARIHTILGWILIPFGLAAITGLLPGK